ncbi:hypothetical protein C492_04315 [Natronococcus jeotgali DSM 18795]|uniref:Uncharacterized protein n=2 Tax=Natronococcus jeotgali TaxID=413812 RepID=L9XSE9_9EURY|nr:hypothetical protein C492_04315 [Natronococcus jeotgali DSM 18795]
MTRVVGLPNGTMAPLHERPKTVAIREDHNGTGTTRSTTDGTVRPTADNRRAFGVHGYRTAGFRR